MCDLEFISAHAASINFCDMPSRVLTPCELRGIDMPLTRKAHSSLAGMWGSYDFELIRDKHFVTASDLVERFLDKYIPLWASSAY
jgi:hypothetical protein